MIFLTSFNWILNCWYFWMSLRSVHITFLNSVISCKKNKMINPIYNHTMHFITHWSITDNIICNYCYMKWKVIYRSTDDDSQPAVTCSLTLSRWGWFHCMFKAMTFVLLGSKTPQYAERNKHTFDILSFYKVLGVVRTLLACIWISAHLANVSTCVLCMYIKSL